jgi:hypothetical protein
MDTAKNVKKINSMLKWQEKELCCEYEKRLVQVGEAAKYLFEHVKNDLPSPDCIDVLNKLKEKLKSYNEGFAFHTSILTEHKRKLGDQLTSLYAQDKINLAQSISASIEQSFAITAEELLGVCEAKSGFVCYVKSPPFDRAYDAFCECFDDCRVMYAKNFGECCERLNGSDVLYCILPIESDSAGELFSVRSLIDTHELKICAQYKLETENDTTCFALLSNESRAILGTTDVHFDFSFVCDAENKVPDLLLAARSYGIDVVSFSQSSDICRFRLVDKRGALLPFAVYLYLFFDGVNVKGIYSEI